MVRFRPPGEITMPYKRRTSKERDGRITPRAVELFERLMRLPRPVKWTPENSDLGLQFDLELGLEPHVPHPVFDCDRDEPPLWMDDRDRIADYHRSRQIRLELERALRERRKARAAQPAPAPAPSGV
jgi:hypothetical protein